MRTTALILLLACAFFTSKGQYYQWSQSLETPGMYQSPAMATDDEGNTYVLTMYEKEKTSGSVLRKFSIQGAPVWTVDLYQVWHGKMVVDLQNTVLIAAKAVSDGTVSDVLLKFDPDGAEKPRLPLLPYIGGAGNVINALGVDASNNYYLSGRIGSPVQFGNTVLDPGTETRLFLAKFNSADQNQWATMADHGDVYMFPRLAVDNNGNCYLSGTFGGGFSLQGQSAGSSGHLIARVKANGQLDWIKNFSVQSIEATSADLSGNLIFAGTYSKNSQMGTSTFTINTPADPANGYLAKMDASGNFIFARPFGGEWMDEVFSVSAGAQHIFMCGSYRGFATYGGKDLYASSGMHKEPYVAAYNPIGDCEWVVHTNGLEGSWGQAMAVSHVNDNAVTVAGRFVGTMDFGGHPSSAFPGAYSDVFVARVSHGLVGLDETESSTHFFIFPNPAEETLHVRARSTGIAEFIITDLQGKVQVISQVGNASTLGIDTRNLAKGLYFLSVRDEAGYAQTLKFSR